MKGNATGLPLRYRLAVASRSIAAMFGGYALAASVSVFVALLMPMRQVDATMLGMMLAFVAYLLAFIWCFACRSAWRAWAGVLGPTLILSAISAVAYWTNLP